MYFKHRQKINKEIVEIKYSIFIIHLKYFLLACNFRIAIEPKKPAMHPPTANTRPLHPIL